MCIFIKYYSKYIYYILYKVMIWFIKNQNSILLAIVHLKALDHVLVALQLFVHEFHLNSVLGVLQAHLVVFIFLIFI